MYQNGEFIPHDAAHSALLHPQPRVGCITHDATTSLYNQIGCITHDAPILAGNSRQSGTSIAKQALTQQSDTRTQQMCDSTALKHTKAA